MVTVVGIGDYAISCIPEDTIVTYALASCVALTAYSPAKKVSGMVHIVLPAPSVKTEESINPYYYATTGIPLLISKMCIEYTCVKSELRIGLYGGADSINGCDVFKLGQKNVQAVKDVLKELRIFYKASETGGVFSRTLEMDVATGRVAIKTQPIII